MAVEEAGQMKLAGTPAQVVAQCDEIGAEGCIVQGERRTGNGGGFGHVGSCGIGCGQGIDCTRGGQRFTVTLRPLYCAP
ncbi:hypothetical protein Q427_27850 [Halomonas sp. BC04]|nr:hypothetical protein Q427_27850 [Halomonas sp. BC04]